MNETKQLYQRALDKMIANRDRAVNGGRNCVPTSFNRFSRFWPGVEKGRYYIVTAGPGVGKSKFTKKMFVFDVVDQIITHPEWGIDLHIKYFCLEESKVNFMQTLMSYKMYNEQRDRVSVTEMNSVGIVAEEDVIVKMRGWNEYWRKFESIVDVIDDIRHPTGIFKHTEKWLLEHGHWVKAKREFMNNTTGIKYNKEVNDYYVPNHPDRYTIVVVDHISLISTEKGSPTLRDAIGKLSSDYFLQLRDKFNCSIVNVQQQAAETEKQQFNYKGQSIESKLEPTLAGLGDNKTTARDADVIFGIFAPDRYEIRRHLEYDVTLLQDHYRSLKILKYRDGMSNVRI